MNCACERLSEDHIQLSLTPSLGHLLKPERLEKIRAAMRDVVNASVQVDIDVEDSDKETPAECLARLGHEELERTKQSFHDDPGVQALMSEFGATLNEDSIKPHSN